MSRDVSAGSTMFERCVVSQQEHLEIGRRYIQAFGLAQGATAIVDDMNEGRLPWERAQAVLRHMHFLFIEYIVRRVGFARFSDVLNDPEFISLREESILQRHGPFPQERYARAVEEFAWNSLRQWHLVAHDMGGRNIYEMTSQLARLLRQAEAIEPLRHVPRLPMPSMLLLVPPAAGLTLTLQGFPARDVTEIYAVESPPPHHEWSLWLHAPIDERIAESVYLEITFAPESSFEDSLSRAHDMFQGESPAIQGWKECVRWFAAAMRYLADGGARQEYRHQLEEAEPERRILLGTVTDLQ